MSNPVKLTAEKQDQKHISKAKIILDRIHKVISRHVGASDEILHVLPVWSLLTFVYEQNRTVPYLNIHAAEHDSGKSTIMELLTEFTWQPEYMVGATSASLHHLINDGCTLLLDEIDNVFKGTKSNTPEDKDLNQIINGGNTKSGNVAKMVLVGKDGKGGHKVKKFSTFGPKAFAGNGNDNLSEPTQSRCIPILMIATDSTEDIVGWDDESRAESELEIAEIRELMEEFKLSSTAMQQNIKDQLPDWLKNRKKDMWTPMFKIAKAGGTTWWNRMVDACEKLHVDDDGIKKSTQLLIDLHDWFSKNNFKDDKFLPSSMICNELGTTYSEHGWDTYNFKSGTQINPTQFAKLVGSYPQEKNMKIKSTKKYIKLSGEVGKELRGYHVHQFNLSIERYAMKHIRSEEVRQASLDLNAVEGVESDTYNSTDSTSTTEDNDQWDYYDRNNAKPFKKDRNKDEVREHNY